MKSILVLATLLLSQVFTFESRIDTKATDFRVDELGFIFLVYPQHIEKLTGEGKVLFRTSDLNFGEIRYLDVTNPLRPFVFYKEQSKVVILDNTLSAQGSAVDLFTLGYGQVELVAGSRGDGFWLWDVNAAELIRTDRQFKRTNSTGNLYTLLGLGLLPSQVIEHGDFVYVLDPNQGIFIFDVYANYRLRLPDLPDGEIQVMDDRIIFRKNGQLHILEPDHITESEIPLPAETTGNFHFFRRHLYFLGKEGLNIYSLTETAKN